MTTVPVPYKISRLENGGVIEIMWDQAGHAGSFDAHSLRCACRCAACVEEMSGRAILDPSSVPANVRALSVRLVGAYAAHFQWSDGHSTGIYPWERLYADCPCPACAARRAAAARPDDGAAQ